MGHKFKMREKNLNKFIINDNAPPFFLLGLNVQLVKLPFLTHELHS
jgi:hypothetical protein